MQFSMYRVFSVCTLKTRYHINILLQEFYSSFTQTTINALIICVLNTNDKYLLIFVVSGVCERLFFGHLRAKVKHFHRLRPWEC